MRVGICDDDRRWCAKAGKLIQEYARKTGLEMEIIQFMDSEELHSYEGYPLDVLFMDIVLKDENGIEETARINQKWKDCQIVYLTNYLYYATEVYHTEHIFFALKEQFEERIGEIFGKILHELAQNEEKLYFSLIGGRQILLAPRDILYFERRGRTTYIVTIWGTYTTWDKMQTIMERLPELDFVRCHNSYIVYLPAVREMKEGMFVLQDGKEILISRSYGKAAKMSFMRWAMTQIS